MALKWMRRKQQNLKWVLWLVIIALSGSMLLFFVNPPAGSGASLAAGELARVGDFKIQAVEYRRNYLRTLDTYQSLYQQNPSLIDQIKKGLRDQTLSQLISRYAAMTEGVRLGLAASPAEVFEEIRKYPAFQENGQFVGKERYREVLRANRIPVHEFEEDLKQQILIGKLQRVLTDSLTISEQEVRQGYLDQNQEVQVRYVAINIDEAVPESIDEGDLRAHYDANIAKFQGEERRKVKTVAVEVRPNDVEVSDEEMKAFRQGTVAESIRVSHILLPIEGEEAQVQAKGEALVAELRGGADFVAKARELSVDAETKDKGGDLGFIKKGEREQAFDDLAFTLVPGEIGGPVKTSEGFHVIKVTANQASQADAIAEFQARQVKANGQAKELADKVVAETRAGESLEAVAKNHGLEVKESGYFESDEKVPQTAAPLPFTASIFDLGEVGQVTDPYRYASNHYFVSELIEILPARALTFEEARDKVETDYRQVKGHELAQARAQGIADQVKAGGEFSGVADKEGLRLTTTEFFRKNATIDDTLKFSPLVHDQAFRMKVGDVSTPIQVTANFVVFQVADKSPVDEEKYLQEKTALRDNLLQRKRDRFFGNYLQNVVERLRQDQEIEIDDALLEQVAG